MKTLLIILFTTIYLNAESFYKGKCVDNVIITSTSIYVYFSGDLYSTVYPNEISIVNQLSHNNNNYFYDMERKTCNLKKSINDTKYLLSSLVGILIGFTLLFFSILITIKVGTKK